MSGAHLPHPCSPQLVCDGRAKRLGQRGCKRVFGPDVARPVAPALLSAYQRACGPAYESMGT